MARKRKTPKRPGWRSSISPEAAQKAWIPLLLDRSDIAFPLADEEDARVLATAFAARADLLVTDNLADFAAAGGSITETTIARHSSGRLRQLTQQVVHAPGGHRLTIIHPLDLSAAMIAPTKLAHLTNPPDGLESAGDHG